MQFDRIGQSAVIHAQLEYLLSFITLQAERESALF